MTIHQQMDEIMEVERVLVIPRTWKKTIQRKSGAGFVPYQDAIDILADIVYWYRSSREGGRKFRADMYQIQYAQAAEILGISKTRARKAFQFLESEGLITREFRDVVIGGEMRNNRQYVAPVPEEIYRRTYPEGRPETVNSEGAGASDTPVEQTGDPAVGDNGSAVEPATGEAPVPGMTPLIKEGERVPGNMGRCTETVTEHGSEPSTKSKSKYGTGTVPLHETTGGSNVDHRSESGETVLGTDAYRTVTDDNRTDIDDQAQTLTPFPGLKNSHCDDNEDVRQKKEFRGISANVAKPVEAYLGVPTGKGSPPLARLVACAFTKSRTPMPNAAREAAERLERQFGEFTVTCDDGPVVQVHRIERTRGYEHAVYTLRQNGVQVIEPGCQVAV